MPRTEVEFRSLLVATDVDVLSSRSIVEDRDAYVVVRTPTAPGHYWGNFLLYREEPRAGDRERWEADFAREFAEQPTSDHRAFTWDKIAGETGAIAEFVAAGYDPDPCVALVAAPEELVAHSRANGDVEIRPLDPRAGHDEELWAEVIELQIASRDDGHSEANYRTYVKRRMEDHRARFVSGDGGWFAAVLPDGRIAASCGVIVTQGRARYQAVNTALKFRRRGIASRLVHDVGRHAVRELGAKQLVIAAQVGYHALPLYESLGFTQRDRGVNVTWWPEAPNAAMHPALTPATPDG